MRLIDADALNDILEYMINEADIKSWEYVREPVVAHHYEMLKQQIEEILTGISGLPTIESAQPEIIRCKECKHWDGVDTCDVIDAPVWDNDFCSMAERRSDE